MQPGDVSHIDDLEAARCRDTRLLQEGVDRLIRFTQSGIVGSDDPRWVGDPNRGALGLHAPDFALGVRLALCVGGRPGRDWHPVMERTAAGIEKDGHARDVDDRRESASNRSANDPLDTPAIGLENASRHRALHVDESGAVKDRVTARHRVLDGRLVRDVPDYDIRFGEADVEGVEDATNLVGVADEEPYGMASGKETPNGMRPGKTGSASDHHTHERSLASRISESHPPKNGVSRPTCPRLPRPAVRAAANSTTELFGRTIGPSALSQSRRRGGETRLGRES